MNLEGNTRKIKRLEMLEEEIKDKYGLYDVTVVDKPLQRHSNQNPWPEELVEIVQIVFNKPLMLDHATYVKEYGLDVFYSEPYQPVDIQKINPEESKRYGVKLIPLKRSMHDSATYPYKIIISNPEGLKKPV